MKTERIEFVAPQSFKAKRQTEAGRAGVSVGELIRQRFEPSEEERELSQLTAQLKKATAEATEELAQAVAAVDSLVSDLQAKRRKEERKAA